MKTASETIASYRPALPDHVWSETRSFVTETVAAVYDDTRPPLATHQALMALSGFAEWVLMTGLGALTSAILRADVIDAYAAARLGEVSGAVSERERKLLRTLAGLSTPREQRENTTSAPPSAPYEPWEIEQFRQWADGQSTPARRQTCLAVLALGMGCGLTSSEMLQVRRRDVVLLGDGLPAATLDTRTVPVLEGWHEELASLSGNSDEYLVRPNATQHRSSNVLVSALQRMDGTAPHPQRLRVTWLLMHVEAGTPVPILLQASGVKSTSVLRRVLPYARIPDEDTTTKFLRLSNGGA